MREAAVEKAVCGKCGVDIRDDTLFCYNCGNRVAPAPVSEPAKANGNANRAAASKALDDVSAKLNSSGAALSARPRPSRSRRARVTGTTRVVWEPTPAASGTGVLVGSLVVAFVTFVIVFFTIIWK